MTEAAEQISSRSEFLSALVRDNPVYLISAELPGCGSSTLADGIAQQIRLGHGIDPHVVSVGDIFRQRLQATDEAELQTRLAEINDPETFNPPLFRGLPTDRPVIVDGKLATTVGPQYIDPEQRPIVKIDLVSVPLVSAKRSLQRERHRLVDLFRTDQGSTMLLGRLAMIENRMEHDNEMRSRMTPDDPIEHPNIYSMKIDTSKISSMEVIEALAGETDYDARVPDWEIAALQDTLAELSYLSVMFASEMNPNDRVHFQHQFESIQYNLDRLGVMLHPEGIADIRGDLRKSIIDSWHSLMMKQSPRFFANGAGEPVFDHDSQSWTPEYYKIAEGWPILSTLLQDKSILDPFAGAGTLVHLLAARNIPSKAMMMDIAYDGGIAMGDTGNTYLPWLNGQMSRLLFDNLPSWYKPDPTLVKGYITADAMNIPLRDDSVDYIVADPPYGKNCPSGGIDLLLDSLPEFARVAREGSILMIPLSWLPTLQATGFEVQQLTTDVSRGHSNLPTCYVMLKSTPSLAGQTQALAK